MSRDFIGKGKPEMFRPRVFESESLYFLRICSFLDRYAILFVADMQHFVVDMQFFALFTNKTIYFWSHGTQFRGQ